MASKWCVTWRPCAPPPPACSARRLVTPQTGAEGLPVDKVYVETGSEIAREVYLSLTLNRDKGRIALIASVAGGMDIEEVAAHTPEKIVSVSVHPATGLQPYQCRKLAFALGFEGKQIARLPEDRDRAVPAVPGARCEPGGDQSADRHQGR